MQIPSPQLLNYQRKEKKKKRKEKSIGPYDRGKGRGPYYIAQPIDLHTLAQNVLSSKNKSSLGAYFHYY